eukprot:902501-Pelagomonas_calceolata.AAC.2
MAYLAVGGLQQLHMHHGTQCAEPEGEQVYRKKLLAKKPDACSVQGQPHGPECGPLSQPMFLPFIQVFDPL